MEYYIGGIAKISRARKGNRMSEIKYLKFVDPRRGKTKNKILSIIREKAGKFAFVDLNGKWEEAPGLKAIFNGKHDEAKNYTPVAEKEVNEFIAAKKAKPVKSEDPEVVGLKNIVDELKEETEEEVGEEINPTDGDSL
jgi:hypothetical protein